MRLVMALCICMFTHNISLALPPFQASKWNHVGENALELGDYESAVSHFAKALSYAPDRGEVLYNLGNTFNGKNDSENALGAYNRALSLLPETAHANVYYNIGNTYMKTQDYDSAIAAYKESLKRRPMDKEAKRNLEIAHQLKQEQENQSQKPNEEEEKEQKQDPQQTQQNQYNRSIESILNLIENEEQKARNKAPKPDPNDRGVEKDW